MTDQDYLKQAVKIGNQKPSPYNFGAVIVKNGEIIGEDFNHVHEEVDPTLHAERQLFGPALIQVALQAGHVFGATSRRCR